jgi:hypothetical protein
MQSQYADGLKQDFEDNEDGKVDRLKTIET